MARHHIDWSQLKIDPIDTASYGERVVGSDPVTIELAGAFNWPVGEPVHIDLYGDGTAQYDTVVTDAAVNADGETVLTLKLVKD